MTVRQRILKAVYPVFMWLGGKRDAKKMASSPGGLPPVSFHSLTATINNGKPLRFDELKGKKVLLVNTASNCGYTAQYAELQQLHQQHQNDLHIIGFPANDFKEQERGSDEDIAQFCTVNFGVNFPLAKKSSVVTGAGQNPVFNWLSDKTQNGWNDRQPEWNFAKYLVNEDGVLTNYFSPQVSPLSTEVLSAISK